MEPQTLNLNLRIDSHAEAWAIAINRSLYRVGFRGFQFSSASTGPYPHITLVRYKRGLSEYERGRLEVAVKSLRDEITAAGGAVAIGMPRLSTLKGSYILCDVVPSAVIRQALVRFYQSVGHPPDRGIAELHLTLAATRAPKVWHPRKFPPARHESTIDSIRLSMSGQFGTCRETLFEVPIGSEA